MRVYSSACGYAPKALRASAPAAGTTTRVTSAAGVSLSSADRALLHARLGATNSREEHSLPVGKRYVVSAVATSCARGVRSKTACASCSCTARHGSCSAEGPSSCQRLLRARAAAGAVHAHRSTRIVPAEEGSAVPRTSARLSPRRWPKVVAIVATAGASRAEWELHLLLLPLILKLQALRSERTEAPASWRAVDEGGSQF